MSDRLFLLDTNVLLALVRGNALGTNIDARFGLRNGRQRHAISVVTHGEIWVLARRNEWGAKKREPFRTPSTLWSPSTSMFPK